MTSLKIENCDLYIKRHRGLKYRLFYNGPVIVSYTQRRKQTVFYLFVTFTSRENVLNENTVRTEGIQITLYFIMSYISLVRHCCIL